MFNTRHIVFTAALLATAVASAHAAPTNDDFINSAYSDLLHRVPSPSELSSYETFLNSNSRQAAAYAIETTGTEFHGVVLNKLYALLLHRSPSPPEQSNLLPQFSSSTIEQVEALIAGSSEYFANRGNSNNTDFLNALFPDLLNRSPSSSDLAQFNTFLNTNTRQQAATVILGSTEYQNDLVTGYYQQYLHRSPTAGEIAPFVSQLQGAVRDEVVISEIIGSSEYFANAPEPASLALFSIAPFLLLRRKR